MKKFFLLTLLAVAALASRAQSALPQQMVLTPYIQNDQFTPNANKILLDKLNRIVSRHGVSSSNGLQSPFIITANAIELNQETTATVPPRTAVDLSLTLYIGNGEEGIMFSTCNMNLRGVGNDLDRAYAAAFKRINVDDPQIISALDEARTRIARYYQEQGPALINKARSLAEANDYNEAYNVLLRIPAVCPQYDEAQTLLLELVRREADSNNRKIIADARAAWSADPTETGAANARQILSGLSNISPAIQSEASQLTSEMASRLQSVADSQREHERQQAANAHAEEMASIESATKIAVARAKNQPTYHYHFHWW